MSTIPSNTEKGSCELAEARLNGNRRIRKWLGRISRSRARRRCPPSVTGTEVKAFNVPAMFSPNPTVAGNVIGSKHPSNPHFHSFIPQMGKSTATTVRQSGCHITAPLKAPQVNAPLSKALLSARPSSEYVPSQRRVRRRKTAPQPLWT